MAKEKFVLLSLQEEKARKLAQVISSESCRRILDALADNDMTATQISRKLDLPLSTVHYNLQNLVKGGLVVCEEFHFSPKGKEVNHYKLASKYIIIAPRADEGFKEKLKGILPVGLIVGAAALALRWARRFFPGEAVISASMPVAKQAAEGMDQMALAAPLIAKDAAAPAIPAAAEPLPEAVTAVSQSPWQDIVLWFVIGAIVALGAYALVSYLRKK